MLGRDRGCVVQGDAHVGLHPVPLLQHEREVVGDLDVLRAGLGHEGADRFDPIPFADLVEDVPSDGDPSDDAGTGSVGALVVVPGDHHVRGVVIESAQRQEAVVGPVPVLRAVHLQGGGEASEGDDVVGDPSRGERRILLGLLPPYLGFGRIVEAEHHGAPGRGDLEVPGGLDQLLLGEMHRDEGSLHIGLPGDGGLERCSRPQFLLLPVDDDLHLEPSGSMDCTLETISSSLSWEHVTPLTTPVTISTISPLVCILSSGGMTLEVFTPMAAKSS